MLNSEQDVEEESDEVREHAVTMLFVLIDKHHKNKSSFKHTKHGVAVLLSLNERVAGTGTKTEDACLKCIEILGGVKALKDSLGKRRRRRKGRKRYVDV